jgi:hypothetical protein
MEERLPNEPPPSRAKPGFKRAKIGDVIEIPTSKGLRYAQYSHDNPVMGTLLRVLPAVHMARPASLRETADAETLYYIFFPVRAAVRRKIFEIVDNCPIPPHSAPFPLFRGSMPPDREGRYHAWWLWDGDKEWRIETLNAEQRRLSLRQICNDTYLVHLLETGWTPADEC